MTLPSPFEEHRIGFAVRMAREELGLSQAAFAALAQSRGLAWHQSTVARLEAGTRSLRLAEALVLASAGVRIPSTEIAAESGRLMLTRTGR